MSDLHAGTVPFVRETMLPETAPPRSSIGALGWSQANLFSGPVNTLVTIASVLFVYYVLSIVVPWIWSPTWNAGSLTECRAITGGDHSGACWGVIRERWPQLLFGFYPDYLRWRPVLAMVLLIAAVAPILFQRAPKPLLYLTAIYPLLMPWLLWGGTLWLPLTVAAGVALAWLCIRFATPVIGSLGTLVLTVAVTVSWWLFAAGPLAAELHDVLPVGLEPVASRQFGGFMLSVTIGVVAIGCSLPIGIVLALGRQSDLLIVKTLCVGFIEFIRGVPLITLLFVASTLLNIFLPPGTEFDIILRVIIMVTLFASAYMAEVIRGGLAALGKGQYEGADSLGLDYWQAQRLIIMPQALKISIPGIVSVFIGVFKDTTLVSIIGLLDPLGLSNAIRADSNWNGIVWELYGFIAALFFVFCFLMSRYSMHLERRLAKDNH